MKLEEALTFPGQLVAAWDDSDEAWLGIFAATESGVKLLFHERVLEAQRAAVSEALAEKAAIGATAGGEYVWAKIGGALVAWNFKKKLFAVDAEAIRVGDNVVPTVQATRVTSFVDDNDLGHRGVRVERKMGGPVVIAEERDPTPEIDPTYDRSNVALDAAWASALGRAVARALGLQHVDQI